MSKIFDIYQVTKVIESKELNMEIVKVTAPNGEVVKQSIILEDYKVFNNLILNNGTSMVYINDILGVMGSIPEHNNTVLTSSVDRTVFTETKGDSVEYFVDDEDGSLRKVNRNPGICQDAVLIVCDDEGYEVWKKDKTLWFWCFRGDPEEDDDENSELNVIKLELEFEYTSIFKEYDEDLRCILRFIGDNRQLTIMDSGEVGISALTLVYEDLDTKDLLGVYEKFRVYSDRVEYGKGDKLRVTKLPNKAIAFSSNIRRNSINVVIMSDFDDLSEKFIDPITDEIIPATRLITETTSNGIVQHFDATTLIRHINSSDNTLNPLTREELSDSAMNQLCIFRDMCRVIVDFTIESLDIKGNVCMRFLHNLESIIMPASIVQRKHNLECVSSIKLIYDDETVDLHPKDFEKPLIRFVRGNNRTIRMVIVLSPTYSELVNMSIKRQSLSLIRYQNYH